MTSDWVLTPDQRAVVDHPQLPVRIAAGAGTGKTSTIVHRLVGCIDQGMAPEEALGITFTNKAAEELADRLRAALPEHRVEGREVEVTTYHGFAYSLLQEFGAFVGIERLSLGWVLGASAMPTSLGPATFASSCSRACRGARMPTST